MGNVSGHQCKVKMSGSEKKVNENSYDISESIFLSRVEGRGFHVEGEGTMSRVEGNIFFFHFFFFGKGNNRCNQCH